MIVIDYLASEKIPSRTLAHLKKDSEVTKYDITGNGYFLTISHPNLPVDRMVCSKPKVIGDYDGIQTGFIVFIENRKLTIECHSWGDCEIPSNYRDKAINVKVAE